MSAIQEAPVVTFQREGDIAVVTLNRPYRRNALSLELMAELIRTLDEIGENREIRGVILAAAGNVFCSGHDLSEMTGRDINEYRRIFDVCTQLMEKLQSIAQPVIAEVQGIATAAGPQGKAHADCSVLLNIFASVIGRFGRYPGPFSSIPGRAISFSIG